MSIFSKIKSAIFGEKGPLGSGHFGTPKPAAPAPAPAPAAIAPKPAPAAPAAPAPQTAPAATQPVDVEAVLAHAARHHLLVVPRDQRHTPATLR